MLNTAKLRAVFLCIQRDIDNSVHIKRSDILASSFFFFYFGAAGALKPYLTLYYQSRGMSHQNIGYLVTISTVIAIIAAPLWSALADSLRIHRILLIGAVASTLIPVWLLMQAENFITLAIGILLFVVCLSPINPIADNAILTMLPRRERYGQLRLWGSVGWGVAAWVTGTLVEANDLTVLFFMFIGLMFINIFITAQLPVVSPVKSSASSFKADMKQLLKNGSWLAFLAAVFLAGICLSIINNYLALYLKDLGAKESLFGLSVAVSAFSELPIFVLSPFLLRKFSPRGVLLIGFSALAVRTFFFSILVDPQWVLVGQLLHGISFAGMWTAAVVFVNKIAPPHLGASAQAMLGMVMFGAGGVAGALIGAQLYDSIGPANMFRVTGLIALGGVSLFWLLGDLLTEKKTPEIKPAHSMPS